MRQELVRSALGAIAKKDEQVLILESRYFAHNHDRKRAEVTLRRWWRVGGVTRRGPGSLGSRTAQGQPGRKGEVRRSGSLPCGCAWWTRYVGEVVVWV
jgi:hypothetical protein